MAVAAIDLNADLGEECGGDDEIFPCLSSANICCGAHAGGPSAIDTAVRSAARHDVTIGAHIGYEDRANFGRTALEIEYDALYDSVSWQLDAIATACQSHSTVLRYVKPHGALYHRIGTDPTQARAVVDAVRAHDPALHLLVPNQPAITGAASNAGLECRFEYFADRGYNADGTLVDRRHPGAMLHSRQEIVDRALRWLETGRVRSIDGEEIVLQAHSICLHGDEREAIASAHVLRNALDAAGYAVRSWRVP